MGLSESQHGPVAEWQLEELGLARHRIDHRVRCGELLVLYPGVCVPGHRVLTRGGRVMAAVLASGKGAVLSHHSAASWWGIRDAGSSVIHTTARTHRAGHCGVLIHRSRTLLPRDTTFHEEIPITTISRTLLDLAGVLSKAKLARACTEAERRELIDMREFEDVIERSNGRKGVKNLIDAVGEEYPLTKSEFEEAFHSFLADRGFPKPISNDWLSIGDGWEMDAQWPRQEVAVELDSWQWHRTRREFERDRRRDAQLTAAGWRVIRITWGRFHGEPDAIAAELRVLLRGESSRRDI